MEKIQAQAVAEALKEQFGNDIQAIETLDMLTFTISKSKIVPVVQFLYNHPVYQFQFLTTLCGMHFPNAETDKQLGMVYQLHSLVNNLRIRLKLFFPDNGNPEIPTLTNIFLAANWMERETYDFFGFKFPCHPNLKRILNMENINFFPMRKEFPLEDQTRTDKDDNMFGR